MHAVSRCICIQNVVVLSILGAVEWIRMFWVHIGHRNHLIFWIRLVLTFLFNYDGPLTVVLISIHILRTFTRAVCAVANRRCTAVLLRSLWSNSASQVIILEAARLHIVVVVI